MTGHRRKINLRVLPQGIQPYRVLIWTDNNHRLRRGAIAARPAVRSTRRDALRLMHPPKGEEAVSCGSERSCGDESRLWVMLFGLARAQARRTCVDRCISMQTSANWQKIINDVRLCIRYHLMLRPNPF
jgi:hypothetical protein